MECMPTREQILESLRVVVDPELRQDIVTLGMVRSIKVSDGGVVDVTVSLTTPGCPIRSHFQTSVATAARGVEGVNHVNVGFDVLSDSEKQGLQQKLGRSSGLPEGALAQVANVVCVGSGKGGVGKSTLTVNLAAALQAEGKKVGVLDADVWGYSIPRMLGLGGQRPKVSAERKILPLEAHGLKVARRAAQMADKVNLEISGVIENMSGFTAPDGARYPIFGEGGGQRLADELDVPLLGQIPLTMPLRAHADAGIPLVAVDPDDPAAQAIRHAARGLVAMAPA